MKKEKVREKRVCVVFNTNILDLELGSELYLNVESEIIKYHNENDIGIVVCSSCHSEIDSLYKTRKNENKQNL